MKSKKIGNIISKFKLDEYNYFNYYENYEDCNNSLPKLIVGLDYSLELFKDFIIPSKYEIFDDTYWTFHFTENRDEFNKRITLYINECITRYLKNFNFITINPIYSDKLTVMKHIKDILSSTELYSFFYKKNCYIFNLKNIYFLDFRFFELVGCNIEKIKNKIIDKSFIIDSDNISYGDINELYCITNGIKYIPLFYWLKK